MSVYESLNMFTGFWFIRSAMLVGFLSFLSVDLAQAAVQDNFPIHNEGSSVQPTPDRADDHVRELQARQHALSGSKNRKGAGTPLLGNDEEMKLWTQADLMLKLHVTEKYVQGEYLMATGVALTAIGWLALYGGQTVGIALSAIGMASTGVGSYRYLQAKAAEATQNIDMSIHKNYSVFGVVTGALSCLGGGPILSAFSVASFVLAARSEARTLPGEISLGMERGKVQDSEGKVPTVELGMSF